MILPIAAMCAVTGAAIAQKENEIFEKSISGLSCYEKQNARFQRQMFNEQRYMQQRLDSIANANNSGSGMFLGFVLGQSL